MIWFVLALWAIDLATAIYILSDERRALVAVYRLRVLRGRLLRFFEFWGRS